MFKWRDLHSKYVNLSHRVDRENHMQKELARVGLRMERHEGILTKDQSWNRYPFQKLYARTSGAIGCALTQSNVMAEAYNMGKGVWINEDDLVYATDIIERLDYIEEFINKHPNTDIFFMGGTVHTDYPWWHRQGHEPMLRMCECDLRRDAELTDDEKIIRVYGMFSTHSWIVPYEKIPKILGLIASFMHETIGIDFSLIRFQPQLECYALLPGSVRQIDNMSDIGNGMTVFSGFSKLGSHWFQDSWKDFDYTTVCNQLKR